MRRDLAFFLALALIGSAGGCAERFLDFRVERIVGLRVTRIDGRGFESTLHCELSNPNPLGAELEDIRFEARLGSHRLGRGRLPGPVSVAARSRFPLEVPVRIDYAALPADFPEQVKDGTLRITTTAELRAKTRLGSYRMRLTSSGVTRIADQLAVAVKGAFQGQALQVESIGLLGMELRRVRLRVRLLAKNFFAFPIRIRRAEVRLDINDHFFGESRLDQPLALPARSSRPTELIVTATHGAVASVIGGMLGQAPRFRIRGTVWIDPIGGVSRIPLDVQADSSVFKSE